ncbi:centrosomal protein of 162 kDa isoform X2 [Tachyglossus aculeatus]|uniref:centrosomal protein of 162 kDa isoform X2 n=1 Tax=Tachyglossus aculeatus TaxID=9261 RepID=UPI0018F607F7|nr:centrosomal protein of 162 kDa isoform X2 [Tachyglossus aculeatus]
MAGYSKEELDEQFERFLKEDLSDDSIESSKTPSVLESLGKPRKRKSKKKDPAPWWITEDDSDDGGVLGASGHFLKSQKTSQPMVKTVVEESAEIMQLHKSSGTSNLSRDSLETNDSILASGPNHSAFGIGLDTLEEQEAKERFLARFQKGITSTIDYSGVNKELDSNSPTQFKGFFRNYVKSPEEENEDDSKLEEISEKYSDDFEEGDAIAFLTTEDEESEAKQTPKSIENKAIPTQEEEKTGMLAKVVLLDSLDSVADSPVSRQGRTTPELPAHPEAIIDSEMAGTGGSYGQTNSDIEALQQAYYHIDQSLGDTDEQRIQSSAIENATGSEAVPQDSEKCSKHISTTESDLPTVEELMKPIKADSLFGRGFNLRPASPNRSTDHLPREESLNEVAQEKQHLDYCLEKKNEKNPLLQTAGNEASEESYQRTAVEEEKMDKMYLDILRKKLSLVSQQENKNNQGFGSRPSSREKDAADTMVSKQTTYKKIKGIPVFCNKKPQSGLYGSVKSSGYGKSNSPFKPFSTVSEKKASKDVMKKASLKMRSPPDKARQKETFSTTKVIRSATAARPSLKSDSLVAAEATKLTADDLLLQAVAKVDSSRPGEHDPLLPPGGSRERELYMLKRVQEAEEKWNGAQTVIEQIKATFQQKEIELVNKMEEMKGKQEKEILRLSQENYILQTKVNNFEETNKKPKFLSSGEAVGLVTEEKLQQIQKEIEEQEVLLKGYQQENERLYKQGKELHAQNKANEERMFKENQCLLNELASLKEQLHKSTFPSQVAQDPEPQRNMSFTELLTDLRAVQKENSNLLEELKRLKQDKQALEVDLGQMKRERDLAKDQVVYISDETEYKIKIVEETHKQEISRLQKRLQWYAENQDLLDKDAARLREANEEIEKLKLQVEKLKTEAGDQSAQQKVRLKDRAVDAKKIQDLQRQVKEMEGILKRRYPNSLPALIFAASAEGDGDISAKNRAEFMEKRVRKLEADLEGKDEEAKKSLRTMEQQFQKIKIQYEQRIEELEQLLSHKLMEEPPKRSNSPAHVKALEQELCDVKEAHQITVRNLEAEIEELKKQNAQLDRQKNERGDQDFQAIEFQVEQAHAKARLARLNQELVAKGKEIQDLTKTVERLQRERRRMLSDPNTCGRISSQEKSAKKMKKEVSSGNKWKSNIAEPFSGAMDNKLYQPQAFADSHVSEILQENSTLKDKLEKLTLEMSEQKVKSEAALVHSEDTLRRTREETAEHLASLKAAHQREVEKLICQHAIENSSSRVAELNRKVATQEVFITHLQEQVNELQRCQEALAVSQVREEVLQKEMTKLLEELRKAEESHTPEMKHFLGLERKLKLMEIRHTQREQELQQIIQQTRQVVEAEQIKEMEKWKRLAQLKNQELEKFRVELDSILDVLQELHRQGVVIPVPFSHGSNPVEFCWKP